MSDPLLDRTLPSEATPTGYVLRMSRPRFWPYLAGPVVVGVAYAAASTAELFAPVAVALFVYFLLPANVFLYGVNDVFDADVDAVEEDVGRQEEVDEQRDRERREQLDRKSVV